MGKKVNVVLWDGKVVSVDEELAGKLTPEQGRAETGGESGERARQKYNEENTSAVRAGAEGALDTLTLGAYGKVAGVFDGHRMEATAEAHPGARMVGEVGAMLLPTGLLGKGAQAAGEATLLGQAGKLGARIGGKAGLVTEGAIMGLGSYVADTNVTGDPLTIEGALINGGIGGLIDLGFGVLGSKMHGAGGKAKAAIAEETQLADHLSLSEDVEKRLESGAWKGVQEAHKASESATSKAAREVAKDAEEFASWAGPDADPSNINGAVKGYQKARQQIQSDILATKYGQEQMSGVRAASRAEQQFTRETEQFDKFVNSTEKFPRALEKADTAINQIADRYGIAEGDELLDQLAQTKARLDEGAAVEAVPGDPRNPMSFKMTGGAPLRDIGGAPPVSMNSRIKELKDLRRSAEMKTRGGWREEGGRWVSDPNVLPDPAGGMADFHSLREKIGAIGDSVGKGFPSVQFPDLPKIPVKPEAFSPGSIATEDVAAMAKASSDLGSTIENARQMIKAKDYEGAIAELRAARSRLGEGFGHLEFPELPVPPRGFQVNKKIDLAGSVDDFARQKSSTIRDWANQVSEGSDIDVAFRKLADDLGLEPKGMPGDNIASVHAKLGEYRSALDKVEAAAAKSGESASFMDKLGGYVKKSSRMAARRSADTAFGGGVKGVFAGAAAGAAMGNLLDGGAISALGGLLVSGKVGARDKIRSLVAKFGEKAGRTVRRLGPVTAYLANPVFGGGEDGEKDVRSQAVNRIGENISLAQSGPDLLYSAIQPLLGFAGDVGGKLHDHVMNALNHLAETAPKDPGLDVKGLRSNWKPSTQKTVEYAYRIEAVVNPLAAIERSVSGDGNPAGTDTLWKVWPAVMNEYASEMISDPEALANISYERGSDLSQLFRIPITGLQEPAVALALQGLYLPKQDPSQQGGQQPSSNPAGRPAAVQSQVAGSNVAALTA